MGNLEVKGVGNLNYKIKGKQKGVSNLKVKNDSKCEIKGEHKDVGSLDIEGNLAYEIKGMRNIEYKIKCKGICDLEVEEYLKVKCVRDLEDKYNLVVKGKTDL